MNTTIKLTDTQRQVLEHAAQHTGGKIDWFPENLRGGARSKVTDALFARALICHDGKGWCVAAEGYDAIGVLRPRRRAAKPADPIQPRTRANSKQAQVIAMLQRPEGATIPQIMEVTDWQAHTIRGTLAGSFKRKLGLNITSVKPENGERTYRIV